MPILANWQAVEQHEQNGGKRLFFLEEGTEGEQEVGQYAPGFSLPGNRRAVLVRTGQYEGMVEPQSQQAAR